MANMQDKQADQAEKEAQEKLMNSVIDMLKENRNALRYLPDMFEELIAMSEAKAGKASKAGHLYESRSEEEDCKTILEKREKEDLKRRVTFLEDDNRVKNEMIQNLRKNIENKERHIGVISNTNKAERREYNRSDSQFEKAKENDEILKEQTKKFEQEIEQYKSDVSKREKEIEQLKNSLIEKEDQLNELKKYSQGIKDRDDYLIRDIDAKNVEIKEQAGRIVQLQEQLNACSGMEREIEQMKSRIAFLSEKRVKQDQSKVEDTLSKNRQSKLEEDFSNFVDEARMDVCERIQKTYRFKEEIFDRIYCPRLACLIFEAAYERMKEAKEALCKLYKEISRGMIQEAPEKIREFTRNEKQRWSSQSYKVAFSVHVARKDLPYPIDVLDALLLTVKENAYGCNLDCFVDEVTNIIFGKWQSWSRKENLGMFVPSYQVLTDVEVVSYIKKCIQLAWRMVTQVPAMNIEYQSSHLQSFHRRKGYHSGPNMRAWVKASTGQVPVEEIACYLWPGLFDGGGRMIRAGEVLCKSTNGR